MLRGRTLCVCLAAVALSCATVRAAERPLPAALRAAAAAVRPAVVGIEVEGRRTPNILRGFEPGHPFIVPGPGEGEEGQPRQWRFEFRWPPRGEMPEGIPEIPDLREHFRNFGGQIQAAGLGRGKGTGLLVSVDGERGLIAAPATLVQHARKIRVRLADGRTLEGKRLGVDTKTGAACIEVRAPNLHVPKPAEADAVQVGDWVVALGGPASGEALTLGIISSKGRPGKGELAATAVLRTDAFVADDMAGGPVVSLKGEVVGISLAKATGRRQRRELTAVLPMATVQATLAELAQHGKVRRGWLGVTFAPLQADERAGLGAGQGVKVVTVVPGQPAANAGIQPGDVLVEFAGKKIDGLDAFRAMVAARKPGQRVAIKLRRRGQELFVDVTLGEPPERVRPRPDDAQPFRIQPFAVPKPAAKTKLPIGVTVQPLTPMLAAQFHYGGDKGLLVTAVEPDSAAGNGRPVPVQRGDLLKEIARKPVATVAEATAALAEARRKKAKKIIVLVRNAEGARYLVIDLPH